MDKKQTKKENWFPGLVVAPNAQEIVKINTKVGVMIFFLFISASKN